MIEVVPACLGGSRSFGAPSGVRLRAKAILMAAEAAGSRHCVV
jgi:hypothetical protein